MSRKGSVLDSGVVKFEDDENVPPSVREFREKAAANLAAAEEEKEAQRREWAEANEAAGERIRARKQAEIEALEKPGREMREQQAVQELANIKADAERAFVASGGDPAKFESEWPTIRDEVLRQRAAAAAVPPQPLRVRL